MQSLVQHVLWVGCGEDGLDQLVNKVVSQVRGDRSVPLLGGLNRSSGDCVLNVIRKHARLGLHKLIHYVDLIGEARGHVVTWLLVRHSVGLVGKAA